MRGTTYAQISGLIIGQTEHEDRDGQKYMALTVDAGVGSKRSTPITVMLFEWAYTWARHFDMVGRHASISGTLYVAEKSGLVMRACRIVMHDEAMWQPVPRE